MGWTGANKLKLNPDKLEVLLVKTNSAVGSGYTPRLAGTALTPRPLVCSLGKLLRPSVLARFVPSWRLLSNVPRVGEIQLVGTWRRAFSVVALLLWKSLLEETYLAPSLLAIRHCVKMDLFR